MNFDESGLPPLQLIQDAFQHTWNYVMATEAEEMRGYERQVAKVHRQNLSVVAQEKRQNKMSEAEYKDLLKQVENIRLQNLRQGPALIRDGLKKNFVNTHLSYARALFTTADNPSPESVAAALLVGTVRSPRDYQQLQTIFGPVVAGLVSELMHAKAYPVTTAETIAAADNDVKRIQLAITIVTLDDINRQVDELRKESGEARLNFPEGFEKGTFEITNAAWGADEKLQTRLVSTFNRAAEKVSSHFRFDRSSEGNLILVPHKPPAPPPKPPITNLPVVRPRPPNNNGAIGKDDW